jgi:hypothetical protein
MKHKIIKTDKYLLVVDDSEIKENNYVYVEGHVKPQMCKGFENNGDVLCYNNLPYIKEKTKKVISHLPLNNSPILEGVDLLPPLEDEVEKFAKEWNDKGEFTSPYSFKAGYNKFKEKYKYTEEDVLDAWELGASEGLPLTREKKNNLIKHLQQPKMPVGFECKIYETQVRDINTHELIKGGKKTTTNSQGLTQWVGEYIY